VIEVQELSVRFGTVTALQHVSLALGESGVTVLLGPSGAGKSTLLRCLTLLTRPTAGRVVVHPGGELRPGPRLREHRRRTGMVFQQHQLVRRHTALQNVLAGRLGYHSVLRTPFGMPRAEKRLALECLERVGILDKALTRVDRLSGGEQQRVAVARALAQQPRRIVADEPVASLDPVSARKLLDLIRQVCREDGIPAILSLHQVALAREYGDRIVGLSGGRVVLDVAAGELSAAGLRTIYGDRLERESSVFYEEEPV
jgi:phosphonate transport system ATP-binding protein